QDALAKFLSRIRRNRVALLPRRGPACCHLKPQLQWWVEVGLPSLATFPRPITLLLTRLYPQRQQEPSPTAAREAPAISFVLVRRSSFPSCHRLSAGVSNKSPSWCLCKCRCVAKLDTRLEATRRGPRAAFLLAINSFWTCCIREGFRANLQRGSRTM